MDALSIVLASVIIIMFLLFMIHQEVLFGRMIKQNEKVMRSSNERQAQLVEQNNTLLRHADERLNRANEMVLSLAHSADKLSVSVSDLKDMAVKLQDDYTYRNEQTIKNRDDLDKAYHSLLVRYNEQQKRLQSIADEDRHRLAELAGRPTVSNTNNNNLSDDATIS